MVNLIGYYENIFSVVNFLPIIQFTLINNFMSFALKPDFKSLPVSLLETQKVIHEKVVNPLFDRNCVRFRGPYHTSLSGADFSGVGANGTGPVPKGRKLTKNFVNLFIFKLFY